MTITNNIIKKLNKYTNNMRVLREFWKMSEHQEDILEIYEELKKKTYRLPDEYADTIILAVIDSIENLSTIKNFVTNPHFLSRVKEISLERLNILLDYVKNNKYSKIIGNPHICENYSPNNLIKVITLAEEFGIETTTVTLQQTVIFHILVENGIGIFEIESIMHRFVTTNDTNQTLIYDYLTNENTYFYASIMDILTVVHVIANASTKEEAELTYIFAMKSNWVNHTSFREIFVYLISYAFKHNISLTLLTLDHIYENRKVNEIREMLELIEVYPESEDYFLDENLLQLTWKQHKKIFLNYNLSDPKTMNIMKIIFDTISEQEKDNLYQVLINRLEKMEYQTTVFEYLDTCETISELIPALEDNNYAADEPISTNALISLTNKAK